MVRKSHWSRNMRRSANLLFILFKTIGLATFSINNRTSLKNKSTAQAVSFVATKFRIFYNLLGCCLTIASNWITIPILYEEEYYHRTNITVIIDIFQGILGSIAMFIILLCYCVNQSVMVRILIYLNRIVNRLHRLQQPVNWKYIFHVLLVVYALELSLLIALSTTDYIAFHTNPISWLSNIWPATFVGLVFIQYFSALILLDTIFLKLNVLMQELCRNGSVDVYLNCFVKTCPIFVGRSSIEILDQVRDIHDRLCGISNDVSEFYSLPALAGISFVFFALLYNAYYLVEPFVVEEEITETVVLTNTLIWIIFLLYPLGLLTNKITKVTKEIEAMGNIVHSLLNCTVDRAMRTELKQFSLQLLHRRMAFTANGYFQLDNTLVQSILSAVTTYVVILIQFQMGRFDKNVKTCNGTEQ